MLDIDYIRENPDEVKENIKNRGMEVDIDQLLELDKTRRALIEDIQEMREERNKKSKGGKPSEEEIQELRQLSNDIDELESSLTEVKEDYFSLLKQVPNKTSRKSPVGSEENFNVLEKNKEPREFEFEPKEHLELMKNKDLVDFDKGAKTTGSSFYFLKNDLVELNNALFDYGVDKVKEHGFTLLETPDLAKDELIEAAGFNPRGNESQVYNLNDVDKSLIGTAEITVLGYHKDEIINLKNGPKKYAAISHCFRKEAGSYGKSSKGLYRVHQFKKLELFVFCKPENSKELHQDLLDLEKDIYNDLEIPFRVIEIATGDLGGPAYRKFDLEAWMTMKGEDDDKGGYGEITSCSNCLDYQARRANIRYKNEKGENEYAHTLNGTAIVSSRVPVSIFENHQDKDGSVDIPASLRGYMDKNKI
ncbi:MAG: serine--tRNA ligase [Candidatus Magasanikbacteria bacterium]